jgi:uncharacterized protein
MTMPVLRRTIEKVFASGLVGEKLSIVWHAGEPLALPISFYEEAFESIAALSVPHEKIVHSMQSNGTLVNDKWCSFIKAHNINLGLSIDGPDFIHDAHRKTRRGKGTHAQVMKGVENLRKNNVEFHVIAVITEQSLDYPDEIFNFFLDNCIRRVGFNIEELEGVHSTSTLAKDSTHQRVRDFLHRMYCLQKSAGGAIKIREFDRAYQAIALSADVDGYEAVRPNEQVTPFGIISVDYDGSLYSFSPELLGMKSSTYGDFCFGNIKDVDKVTDIAKGAKFKQVSEDIQAGVRLCSESCEYFSLCGGGAPSNKYYENSSFASAETMFCRYTIKLPIDIVLADLEESLGINPPVLEAAGRLRNQPSTAQLTP